MWVDLGYVVVYDVVWWCGCGVLICVGVGFRSVGGGSMMGLGCGVMCCGGMGVLVVEVQWWCGAVVMAR